MSSSITSNSSPLKSKSQSIRDFTQETKNDKNIHSDSFFQKQFEVFVQQNYQQLYDCFFSVVKERQVKKNLASSMNSSVISLEDSKQNYMDDLEDVNMRITEAYRPNYQKRKSIPKQAVSNLSDALYLPSSFTKNKPQFKLKVEQLTPEYDFRMLVNKMSQDFSKQLCEKSPYLESVMSDLDNLNQLFAKPQNNPSFSTSARGEQAIPQESQTKSQQPTQNYTTSLGKAPSNAQITQIIAKTIDQTNTLNNKNMERKNKENEQLKEKVLALNQLTEQMRKNYYKDLITYKNPSKNWKQVAAYPKNHSLPDEDQITCEFFNVLDGVDSEILDLINQRLLDMKEKCEKRLQDHIKYQEELSKKIYCLNKLSPNAYSLVNLSLTEIFQSLSQIEPNIQVIWDEINANYGQDCFLYIIEREYGQRFAKDYTFLNQEIDKVKEEAQFQIKEVMKQSQSEITFLRRAQDQKNQEIVHLKENQLKEIEKARKEAYISMEIQFKSREAKLFQKYDAEKAELYDKINELETINTNFDQILVKQSLKLCLVKLSLMGSFHKLMKQIKEHIEAKLDEPGQVQQFIKLNPKFIEDSINRLFDIILGRTTQEITSLKQEYEREIKRLMDENNTMSVEIAEKRYQEQNLEDRITILEQNLSDFQQEAEMFKGQVDSMKEEHRKLEGEHATLKRALDNSQKLAEGFEREKKRLEFELQKFAGNNINKYQSAFAEADLHRKKAMQSISNAGANTMNQIYGMNNKTKGTQTNLKDVNADIIFTKKGALKDGQKLSAPTKSTGIQTTTDGIVILSDWEYKLLQEKASSTSPQRKLTKLGSSHSILSANKKMSIKVDSHKKIMSPHSSGNDDTDRNQAFAVDEIIQCDLLKPHQKRVSNVDSSLTQSISEWKSKYVSNRNSITAGDNDNTANIKQNLYQNLYNLEKELPEVYKRLWINVFQKAANYQKLKQHIEQLRREEFDKIQRSQSTAPKNKVYQKDAITGKVFINLIELYKEAQEKSVMKRTKPKKLTIIDKTSQIISNIENQSKELQYQNKNDNELDNQNDQPLKESDSNKILDVVNEQNTQQSASKHIADQGTQTDSALYHQFMQNRFNKQSRNHLANQLQNQQSQEAYNIMNTTNSFNNTNIKRESCKSQQSKNNLLSSHENSYQRSKAYFMNHQKAKQRNMLYNSMITSISKEVDSQILDSSLRKKNTYTGVSTKYQSKIEDISRDISSVKTIFDTPFTRKKYNKDESPIDLININTQEHNIRRSHSKLSNINDNSSNAKTQKSQANNTFTNGDPNQTSFTIYLNQPKVKISKNDSLLS